VTVTSLIDAEDGIITIDFTREDMAKLLYYGFTPDETELGSVTFTVLDSDKASNAGAADITVDDERTGLTNPLYQDEPILTADGEAAKIADVQLTFTGKAGESITDPATLTAYCRYDEAGIYTSREYQDELTDLPTVTGLNGNVASGVWKTDSGVAYDPDAKYTESMTFYPVLMSAADLSVTLVGVDNNNDNNGDTAISVNGKTMQNGKASITFTGGVSDGWKVDDDVVFTADALPGYTVWKVELDGVDITNDSGTYTIPEETFSNGGKAEVTVYTRLAITDVQIFTEADITGGIRFCNFSHMTEGRSLVVFDLPAGVEALSCNLNDDFAEVFTLKAEDGSNNYEFACGILLELNGNVAVTEEAVLEYLTTVLNVSDNEQETVVYDLDLNGKAGHIILDIQVAYDVYARSTSQMLWNVPISSMLKSDQNSDGMVRWADVNMLLELFK